MVIFYHGDMDGIASANVFIENNIFKTETVVKTYEFEYDKEDAIALGLRGVGYGLEDVIFVDCCPNENVLKTIMPRVRSITILDHHISKKELVDQLLYEGLINGMSYIGASATLLVWAWFHFKQDKEQIVNFLDKYKASKAFQEKSKVPLSIKLVNSWDIWDGQYIDAEAYKTYFETKGFTPLDKDVKSLLENDLEIRKAIREGNIMIEYFHSWGERYCQRYGYEIKYLKYNLFVLNVGNANSKIFGDRINNYDAVIIYCNDGTQYKCSIYSQKNDFNCAEFAEQFDGGGHKGAAGFVLSNLPVWLRDKKSELFIEGDKR